MRNLNLFFNKTYYSGFGEVGFDKQLEKNNLFITSTRFDPTRDYSPSAVANRTFVLETAYPGLLVGIGLPHGLNSGFDNDIGLGFSFDYVTGQPYIPASSVKGVLRHYFEDHPGVISIGLAEKQLDVKALTEEIFDDGDVFLDAVIKSGDKNGRILSSDYITPHKKDTKNPIPIQMIKLVPGVQIEFRFKLRDGILSSDAKEALFRRLLMLFGVGAKTNVGYGILREPGTLATVKQVEKSATSDRVRCSCGKMTYKYYINTTTITKDWNAGVCRGCGKKIR